MDLRKLLMFLRANSFGLAIVACAAVSFSFPSAFTTWCGVKLMRLVSPAAAGGLVCWIFAKPLLAHKAAVDRTLSVVSMAGICYTILALTAPSRGTFKEAGALIILAAALHNAFGYASGY